MWSVFEKNHKILCVPLAHIIVPLTHIHLISLLYCVVSSVQRTLCHYNAVTLPGDCHAMLAMTQYFVRNEIGACLLKSNSKLYTLSLCYPVQRTLCHSEERSDVRIPRKGTILKTTQDTFVLAWKNTAQKKHAVGRVFESRFVLPCYLPTNPLMASSISL